MSIPFPNPIYVTKTTLPPLANYTNQLADIWANNWVTNNGPKTKELSRRLEEYLGVPNCAVVNNGTIALQIAIRALGLSGSVITTPFSYVATTNALLWEGIAPLFVDVEPDTFTLDPALVEAAIRPDTTGILATHVYGYPCHHAALQDIANRHGLKLIYDAAHAFGVEFKGESIIQWGDASTLSFHATKVFHTIEGGGIVTSDDRTHLTVDRMRAFGHVGRDYYEMGINGKNCELHSAMGLLNLDLFKANVAARRRISERYVELLAEAEVRVLTPTDYVGLTYNYGYLPIIFDSYEARERVVAYLNEHNVFPRRYFEPSLNTLPFLADKLRVACPVSERAARTVLCLPLYPDLPPDHVTRIAELVRQSLKTVPA